MNIGYGIGRSIGRGEISGIGYGYEIIWVACHGILGDGYGGGEGSADGFSYKAGIGDGCGSGRCKRNGKSE